MSKHGFFSLILTDGLSSSIGFHFLFRLSLSIKFNQIRKFIFSKVKKSPFKFLSTKYQSLQGEQGQHCSL